MREPSSQEGPKVRGGGGVRAPVVGGTFSMGAGGGELTRSGRSRPRRRQITRTSRLPLPSCQWSHTTDPLYHRPPAVTADPLLPSTPPHTTGPPTTGNGAHLDHGRRGPISTIPGEVHPSGGSRVREGGRPSGRTTAGGPPRHGQGYERRIPPSRSARE